MKIQRSFEPLPPVEPQREVPRTVFFEEHSATQFLKVVALGEIDETLFAALEAFIARQKRRRKHSDDRTAASTHANPS